jgi:catechol 2,3-dioxygenase-like lactoylglutathione lyase family enzyme
MSLDNAFAAGAVPPNVLSPMKQRLAVLLKRKRVRELILLWPTITRRRFSNKTEDYGVFKPSLVDHIAQLSIYVRDIERSRTWYERVAGMTHSRTCAKEPHPFKPGWSICCCYMSAGEHDECLVLIEERDPAGKITVPSGMSFFHFALEVGGNRLEDVMAFAERQRSNGLKLNYGPVRHNSSPPLGDGETGGNVACYMYDPDYNNVEFCGAMDTIDNYRERYGNRKGSERM